MKIVIVGAGISGLASAWYLNKKFGKQAQIRILEKSDRVGGWIHTINEKGFLFEQGPRGFRPTGKGKTTLSLVKELGLEPIAANAQAKKRYLLHHGKLCAFSPLFLFRQGFLSAIFHDLRTPPSTEEDETIADFFRHRFNDRITERLIDPFPNALGPLEADGLILDTPEKVIVTPLGELFVRLVAMSFDAYRPAKAGEEKFSRLI